MSDRVWWAIQAFLVVLAAAWIVQAQDHQPALDLPERPENYVRLPAPPPAPVPAPPAAPPPEEPAPIFYGEEIESPNATIVYVLDVSGSMLKHDRIKKAQTEATRSIAGLPESFRFNVVTFSCTTKRLWPSLRRADHAAKAEASAFVRSLVPYGATATGPGTALALSDKQVQAVALLTDGIPSCGGLGVDGHRALINTANSQRAVINVFGVAASSSFRDFLRNVASDGGGNYYDVP
jgi:secreted protein with Ig-like and vWFA domain